MTTALASALEFLRLARANLADAASELELTDRHDAALLAEHCDRTEQDIRAIESALTASAAATGLGAEGRAPDPVRLTDSEHRAAAALSSTAAVAPMRVSSPRSPAGATAAPFPAASPPPEAP